MLVLYLLLTFRTISMTFIGVENKDTTYFYVDIQNVDSGYLIHARNTKGLDTRAYADTGWRLLTLTKVQPGRVKMKEEWRDGCYFIEINGKKKRYESKEPLIDRHIVGYFLATQKDCDTKRFKMLVPEKGIFPFKSKCYKKRDKLLKTLEIGGLYRAIYRKTFYFLFDTAKPLMYQYWDNEKRGLLLKDYKIE